MPSAAGEHAAETQADPGSSTAPKQSLAQRTMNAAQWRFGASIVRAVLQFGVGVLLARLLPPEVFGVVALAMVVVGFATLVSEFGLSAAVVQRDPLSERHIRVAITASVLLGGALTLLLFAIAPWSASLLRDPRVPGVLRLQSLTFLFAALGATARALLERKLDFRRLFIIDLVSYVGGYALVSTGLALAGFGVWSLVWGALLQALLGSLLALAMARPPLYPLLARSELRDLAGFGVGVSLNSTVNYVARNGDNLIVGRWLGAFTLGLYARAYSLMSLPLDHVGNAISSVLFPALATIREDKQRLGRAYLASVELTALAVAPIMAGMMVAGPHLIVGLYGPQWSGAALPLQILCAVGVFRTVYHVATALTYAAGQVFAEFRRQAVYAVLVVGASLLGTRYGIAGVAFGVAVAVTYMYLAIAQLSLQITGLGWRPFLWVQPPGLLVAGVVALAAIPVRLLLEQQGAGSVMILAALVLVSAATVPLGIYLLPPGMRPHALFRRLDRMVARFPGAVRSPIRRVMRITPEGAPAIP